MGSESKKPQLEEKEESWIDKLAKIIVAYDSTPIREKQILKFLQDSIHGVIMKEKNKRDVSKLVQASSDLSYHYREMKEIMLKAENFDDRGTDMEVDYMSVEDADDDDVDDDDDDEGSEENR
jgi:cobalamin biosynthesis protein CobT